tara:strand:+ start:480 stop:2024 length:1545 start_codon:yes stop_codon:yes gene_type:complete
MTIRRDLMQQAQKSVLDLIEAHACKDPDRKAIDNGNFKLTYGGLWHNIEKISEYIQAQGIEPGTIIAVVQYNVSTAIETILGVMHAGCIYTPISADIGPERINNLVSMNNISCVISDAPETTDAIKNATIYSYQDIISQLSLATSPVRKHHPVAYVMFTSGSTGVPKGVVISHANLYYVYNCWRSIYGLEKIKRHLQVASLSFDVFAGDWIRALGSGATLYIPDIRDNNVSELYKYIERNRVECAEFTPIILRNLLDHVISIDSRLESFKVLVAGSDVMHINELKKIKSFMHQNARLFYSYGTTETTIDSVCLEVKPGILNMLPDDAAAPIGKPIPGTKIQILDENYQRVADGTIGELYIGGHGVGVGYLKHTKQTAGRYLSDINGNLKGTWYKSGDLASWKDGILYLHGRSDHIIKYEGRVVDISVIENKLRSHPGIEECALVPVGEGLNQKISIFIKAEKTIPMSRSQIVQIANDSFISEKSVASILVNNEIPLTTSGKADRKKLREIMEKL